MKIHPKDFALEEFLLSLSREHLSVAEHLISCGVCRRRFQGLMRHRTGPVARRMADVLHWPEPADDYAPALQESEQVFRDREGILSKERSESPTLFLELTRHPRDQRELLLKKSPRFHTWGVLELLVERSLEMTIRNPFEAEDLGLLAVSVSEYLDVRRYAAELVEDLRGRAWAYVANARRVRSDLPAAEEAFAKAYQHLQKGTQDALERAILFDLEASLRRAQRRFNDAFKLLRRAISIFLQSAQAHRAGRSLLKMSTLHHQVGNLDAAIQFLYQALRLIDPEQEPRLLLCARHNLIDDLAEAGRFLEAQKLYRESRPFYRDFTDAWTQNRRKWVKGKISHGLGQTDQAESLFLAARDGFLSEGIPYDTALVSLELASLYAKQGRMADLKRLAAEMVPIFSSLNIHREALAALAFLRHAVQSERANEALIASVAEFLRRARHDPALRFHEAGE